MTAPKPTETQYRTLRALNSRYGIGTANGDDWKPEPAVRGAADQLGWPYGSWRARLAQLVKLGWAERQKLQHHGYVEWRVTEAGLAALAVSGRGKETR